MGRRSFRECRSVGCPGLGSRTSICGDKMGFALPGSIVVRGPGDLGVQGSGFK